MPVGLPDRGRHGDPQIRSAAPDLPGTATARQHYGLGRLPQWAAIASRAPRAVNALTRIPGVAPLGLTVAGLDRRRHVPAFAPRTFRKWFADTLPQRSRTGDPVLLFVDTFTEYFTPEIGAAAVRVLDAAGYSVHITDEPRCCGLTWITTGQLDQARKIVGRTVAELFRSGMPIVGLEPSCTAVLRSDVVELLGSAPARLVADSTTTLAELLADWEPPSLDGTRIVAQPHCHHHAVMGWGADAPCCDAPVPTCSDSPAAAAWPETSGSNAGTTRCRWRSRGPNCCRRSRRHPTTR